MLYETSKKILFCKNYLAQFDLEKAQAEFENTIKPTLLKNMPEVEAKAAIYVLQKIMHMRKLMGK